MTCSTPGCGNDQIFTADYGLPQSHVYTILGAYTIKDDANKTVKLYQIRNPWGYD